MKPKKWSNLEEKRIRQRDKIIEDLYSQGYKAIDIARELKCCEATIYNALKRLGKETRQHKKAIKETTKQEIISNYQNYKSIWSISKEFNIGVEIVKRIIKESGCKQISYAQRLNPTLKENYFEEIDSSEKAYWLGWIITDGCINGNALEISLQERDVQILQLLEEDLGVKNKVSTFNEKYKRISIHCKQIVADLQKYGIVENKTFSVDIPKIDEKYYPALLRGCFEGDGGVTISRARRKEEYEVSFTGNYQCVNSFNQI